MRQVVLEKPRELKLSEIDEPPPPGPDGAVVRIHRVGICGTDLHAFQGRQPFFSYPRRLGHELGVEVLEIGENVTGIAKGDRCSVEPYLTCGHCVACKNGKSNCCVDLQCLGVHTDGGMCDYFALPADKLHPSSLLTYDQLALVETLGIGAHGVVRAKLKPREWALVIGAGPIGLAAIQFATVAGANVIAADTNQDRLEFCRKHLGVEHLIDAHSDIVSQLENVCSKRLPDAVLDCTGNKASMESAFRYVCNGGRMVFVGLGQFDIAFHDPDFHRRELTLFASRNSTGKELKGIIQDIESGRINTDPWITHRTTLENLSADFPSYLRPETGCVKAMIEVC